MRYDERRNWELYWLVDPLDGTVEFIKGNNEFTVNIALMENNVAWGLSFMSPISKRCTSPGAIRVPTSRSISRRMPPPNTPTTRSSRAGGSCRSKRGRSIPACGGRVAVAPDARNGGAYRPPARSASRSGDRRAGEFLQILPAGRGEGRLLCPHDAYVRVGHRRGELILAEAAVAPARCPTTGNCSTTRRTCAIRGSSAGRNTARFDGSGSEPLPRYTKKRSSARRATSFFYSAGESASAGFGQLLPANLSLPTSACYSPPTSFSPGNYCRLSPLDHIR